MYDGWLVDCFFMEKTELSSFLRGNLRWYGEKVGQYFPLDGVERAFGEY